MSTPTVPDRITMHVFEIGDEVPLWRTEHRRDAYKDQFGIEHSATVVVESIACRVTEIRDVKCMWGETIYVGGGVRVTSTDGLIFAFNWNYFPSDSMTPYFYADGDESRITETWVNAVEAFNMPIGRPWITPEGQLACPAQGAICVTHHYAYTKKCWKCVSAQIVAGKVGAA